MTDPSRPTPEPPFCPGECIGNYVNPKTGERYPCEHRKPTPEPRNPKLFVFRCNHGVPLSESCPHCKAMLAHTTEPTPEPTDVETLTIDRDSWRRVAERLQSEKGAAERACVELRDQLQVVEHQRDVANQYGQMREDEIATLRAQVNSLEGEIAEMVRDWMAHFEERPNEHGEYMHHGVCSASRRKPPALPDSGCVCLPSVKRDRYELRTLRAQVQQARELAEAQRGLIVRLEQYVALRRHAPDVEVQLATEARAAFIAFAALLSPTGGD